MATAERARYQADWQLRKFYGITLDDYEGMLALQGGLCALCRRRPGKKRLHVDHDHKTSRIRGLLCLDCNRRVLGIVCQEQKLGVQGVIDYADRLKAYVTAEQKDYVLAA